VLADRLLVVVGDDALRARLTDALEDDGYAVQAAGDAVTALARVDAPPDGLVIGVDLPDVDGRELRRALLARGITAPALFLWRCDATAAPVLGESGQDDVLATPVDLDEARARVRALLRRRREATPIPPGSLRMDPVMRAVHGERGAVSLTPTEFRVLAALLERRGVIVRRADIVDAAWPADATVSDNSLDQYIARLRAKLGVVSGGSTIVTTRGVGYRLD
jgi:two-component system response regulator MprA